MTARDVPTLQSDEVRARGVPDRRREAAPGGREPRPASLVPLVWRCTGLALIYFVAGKFGLSLAALNPSASAVWPPTGIVLAALLLYGPTLWPGVFAGAFAVNATSAGSLATSFGVACGNTLEGVVAAVLVKRFAKGRDAFERAEGVFRFAVLSGAGTLISATLGVTSLAAGGFVPWAGYGQVWITWCLGDVVSAWVFTPVILAWWVGALE